MHKAEEERGVRQMGTRGKCSQKRVKQKTERERNNTVQTFSFRLLFTRMPSNIEYMTMTFLR